MSEETPAQFAERVGLSTYVDEPHIHVLDGGSRGYRDPDWKSSGTTSYREATEEEIELWNLLKSRL